jgi:hypothetical protein
MLIETHMLKDYRTRVESVYALLVNLMQYFDRNGGTLKQVVQEADQVTATSLAGNWLPLRYRATDDTVMTEFLGIDFSFRESEILGKEIVVWGDQPVTYEVPVYYNNQPCDSVLVPAAYLIPQEWQEQIEIVELHGVEVDRLSRPIALEIESYRFTETEWVEQPYESHHRMKFETQPYRETREFPVGTAVVFTGQRAGRAAVHLLEPKAPDSFVSWGFFDSIFERKEYVEDYVIDAIAREMLADDPQLRAEFESRLESDSSFAASPRERLMFFYERTPYYDQQVNVYPVARVMESDDLFLD